MFANVHLHCIISNLKKISKMSTLHPVEIFLRMLMHPVHDYEIHKRSGEIKTFKCSSYQLIMELSCQVNMPYCFPTEC